MDELKDRGKRVMNEVKGDIMTKWEEKSRELIDAFLELFGRERLTHIWNESKGKIMQALSPPESPNGSVKGDEEDDDDDEEYGLPDVSVDAPTPPAKRRYNGNYNKRRNYSESDDDERTSHQG